MKLDYKIVNVTDITETLKNEMFQLFEEHYANVFRIDFDTDLGEKEWVILLFELVTYRLVGFSTQMCLPVYNVEHSDSLVLFSGDTIIGREWWGSVTLPIAFLELTDEIKKKHPDKKLYWLLISKGLRTFKYLSVFYKVFYPHPHLVTPSQLVSLMQSVGKGKFGHKYIPEKGIIKATENGPYLKEVFQPVEHTERKEVAFFYAQNPGYQHGDELLCMAEVSEENLHPFVKRLVKKHG